jgi:hypothetical protein
MKQTVAKVRMGRPPIQMYEDVLKGTGFTGGGKTLFCIRARPWPGVNDQ